MESSLIFMSDIILIPGREMENAASLRKIYDLMVKRSRVKSSLGCGPGWDGGS